MSPLSGRSLYALATLAALTVSGCIAQVCLDIVYHLPQEVNPVLAGLAQAAIFALFGQGFFSAHQATMGEMRAAFVSVIAPTSTPRSPTDQTPSASSGSATIPTIFPTTTEGGTAVP